MEPKEDAKFWKTFFEWWEKENEPTRKAMKLLEKNMEIEDKIIRDALTKINEENNKTLNLAFLYLNSPIKINY